MTPSASLLMLLLLSLSQAHPLQRKENKEGDGIDTVDITTRILTTNEVANETLLEGDVLIPRTRSAKICLDQSCRWKKSSNGLVMIPFTINSDFTSTDRQVISQAMQAFHSTTCIRFVPHQNEKDYISIENQGGCFSPLGRMGGKQVLSLNRQGCIYQGVAEHELNHALGFVHEHTRSDRDNYVRINWENTDPQQAYNFDKSSTDNLDTPYDYSSIMHYGKTAFSVNGWDTITPIPDSDIQIGQINGLSQWDIFRINKLYSCE
nr:high choriolytic enzyme 1-like [Monopterus albus]